MADQNPKNNNNMKDKDMEEDDERKKQNNRSGENNPGNFANDREKAREAGQKGGSS
jgi:general stress protein YciG